MVGPRFSPDSMIGAEGSPGEKNLELDVPSCPALAGNVTACVPSPYVLLMDNISITNNASLFNVTCNNCNLTNYVSCCQLMYLCLNIMKKIYGFLKKSKNALTRKKVHNGFSYDGLPHFLLSVAATGACILVLLCISPIVISKVLAELLQLKIPNS